MAQIRYFQRYKQLENHATNNTLHLLQHLYRVSPVKFEAVLQAILDDTLKLGFTFEQQTGGRTSVPDGTVRSRPFTLIIETKLGDSFDFSQLKNHAEGIDQKEGRRFLLGLSKSKISDSENNNLEKIIGASGVSFVARTFDDLVNAFKTVVKDYDEELFFILEDYESFLLDEGLLAKGQTMYAIASGTSMAVNIKHGIYYEPADRPQIRDDFLGLYADKTIQAIGGINKVISGRVIEGEFQPEEDVSIELSRDEALRIVRAVEDSEFYPHLGEEPHRYYLLEDLTPMSFVKSSKYPLVRHKRFDLVEDCGLPYDPKAVANSASEVAAHLDGKSFE